MTMDLLKPFGIFLKEGYSTTGLAHQYQLLSHLHCMRQEPGQSINDFLSQVYAIWDQLSLSEPEWSSIADAQKFTNYRDQQRLILFWMALTTDFEPVRASLLHRSPLPTLEQAISELPSEETRLGTLKSQHLDTVLATHQSRGSPSVQRSDSCRYCHSPDHALLRCPIRVCKHCHKTGPGHYQDDCPRRNSGNTWSKGGHYKSGNRSKSSTASRTAAAEGYSYTVPSSPDPSVPSISMSDIEAQTGSL